MLWLAYGHHSWSKTGLMGCTPPSRELWRRVYYNSLSHQQRSVCPQKTHAMRLKKWNDGDVLWSDWGLDISHKNTRQRAGGSDILNCCHRIHQGALARKSGCRLSQREAGFLRGNNWSLQQCRAGLDSHEHWDLKPDKCSQFNRSGTYQPITLRPKLSRPCAWRRQRQRGNFHPHCLDTPYLWHRRMEGSPAMGCLSLGRRNWCRWDAAPSLLQHLPAPPGPPLLPAAPAPAESPAHTLQGRQALSSSSNTSCTLPPSSSGTGAFPCSAAPSCSRREESTSCTAARRGGAGGHGSLDCSCRSTTGRATAERLLRDGESWPLASPTRSSTSTGV